MIWNRPSGNPIELKDTPAIEAYALKNGWTKAKKTKKTKKKVE